MDEADFSENTIQGVHSSIVLAMTNGLIVQHICSFLTVKTLKQCRLLNRQWNQESTKIVSQKCKKIWYAHAPECGINKIPKLIHLIRSSWRFPCTKFSLDSEITSDKTMSLKSKETTLFAFLQAIAPIVTELEIEGADYMKSIYLLRKMESFPRNITFPRLKTLELWIHNENIKEFRKSVTFMSVIINGAPFLEELNIYGIHPKYVNLFLHGTDSSNNIKRVSLSGGLQDGHLLRLQEMNLKLQYLHLRLENASKIQPSVLTAFLGSYSYSLEELSISGSDLNEAFPFRFPRMVRLCKIEIINSYYYCEDTKDYVDSLRFLDCSYSRHFPALKTLSFTYDSKWKGLEDLFNFKMEPLNTVERLDLPDWLDDHTVVLQAARIFPKLTQLQVPVRTKLMDAVFIAMVGKVKELTLVLVPESKRCLEEMLTGYSEIELQQIKGLPGEQKLNMEKNTEPPKFLQGLRVLEVQESEWYCVEESIGVTEFACRFSLLKLTSLKRLDILDSRRTSRISEGTLREMRSRFVVLCSDKSIQR